MALTLSLEFPSYHGRKKLEEWLVAFQSTHQSGVPVFFVVFGVVRNEVPEARESMLVWGCYLCYKLIKKELPIKKLETIDAC